MDFLARVRELARREPPSVGPVEIDQEYWVEEFGLVGDNSTDNTPLWDKMIPQLGSGAALKFRPSPYLFNSQPTIIASPVLLSGAAAAFAKTKLVRNYQPNNEDDFFISTRNGYFQSEGIDFIAGSGTHGGRCFQFVQQDHPTFIAGSWAVISNCRTMGGVNFDHSGTWKSGLFADGQNTDTSGVRDISCFNCWLFDCAGPAIHTICAQQFTWIGGSWYSAGNIKSIIIGTEHKKTQNVWLAPNVGGHVDVDLCNGITITGSFNQDNGPSRIGKDVTGYDIRVYSAQDWILDSEHGIYVNPYYANHVTSNIIERDAIPIKSLEVRNLTQINLSAGDWDVYAAATFTPGETADIEQLSVSISLTSDTLEGGGGDQYNEFAVPYRAVNNQSVQVGPRRVHVSTSKTVYCTIYSNFNNGELACWGGIYARRPAG